MKPEIAIPKVTWRKHEMILVTLVSAIAIVRSCRDWLILTPQRLETDYLRVYNSNHARFDSYYINVWLPTTGSILLLYLSYLAINRRLIPSVKKLSFRHPTKKMGKMVKKIAGLVRNPIAGL